MSELLVCWKCGTSLASLPLPLSRVAECLVCCADLYVCRLCHFYDPMVADACSEPMAEPVLDKDRANFCEYFQPRQGAYTPAAAEQAARSRAALAALFGLTSDNAPSPSSVPTAKDPTRSALEQLFSAGG
ncbi:conserved hypothetical protein [Gammaproteobacteria bacterium]